MNYGCIGEHLKHSFSKEIHNALTDYQYDIVEIPKGELDEFLTKREFLAINVTIPYKELVIPHLYYIDDAAKRIGAVNTIVNRDGRLYGYNTDFYGMSELLTHAQVEVKGKKVLILGTGGTSKTAYAVCSSLGAKEIVRASRSGKDSALTYEEIYRYHTDSEVIINTTPCGMYPDCYSAPIDIDRFSRLSGVIDAIYNPLRSVLVSRAKERGIAAEGGLYMLVAQAVRASEIFTDTVYPTSATEKIYEKIKRDKENIVLIGMPSSGKSTVGALLAKKLDRPLVDTDSLIVEASGMTIPKIFERYGEDKFREIEAEAVKKASALTASVIATGGGAVLRKENVSALRQNGRLFFLDRPLEMLTPTLDRPTASDLLTIKKRYLERYDIYCQSADFTIDGDGTVDMVADIILEKF